MGNLVASTRLLWFGSIAWEFGGVGSWVALVSVSAPLPKVVRSPGNESLRPNSGTLWVPLWPLGFWCFLLWAELEMRLRRLGKERGSIFSLGSFEAFMVHGVGSKRV